MRLRMIFMVALVGSGALAQTREEGMTSRIAAVRYPPLGEQASLQGDVQIKIRSGMVSLRSRQSLLAQTVTKSAETTIGFFQDTTDP